jgi:hypothetical protein
VEAPRLAHSRHRRALIVLFRTAAGRVSWSHTRPTPLLGIAFVASSSRFAIALRWRSSRSRRSSTSSAAERRGGREARRGVAGAAETRRDGARAGIYTTPDNATALTLKNYLDGVERTKGPGTVLDFTNERALYFLLRRKPPVRCFDIPMLSASPLMSEASLQLQANPPIAVILGGEPAVAVFDGVPNDVRVPELARWIDVTYPKRTQIGRFIVATR